MFTCGCYLHHGITHPIFKTADGTPPGMMSEKSQYAADSSSIMLERCGIIEVCFQMRVLQHSTISAHVSFHIINLRADLPMAADDLHSLSQRIYCCSSYRLDA